MLQLLYREAGGRMLRFDVARGWRQAQAMSPIVPTVGRRLRAITGHRAQLGRPAAFLPSYSVRLRMGRRLTNNKPHWQCWWPSLRVGRFWKRAYHKAVRACTRGHGGRERSIAHYGGTVNYKTW
jgi:hypothetical protein